MRAKLGLRVIGELGNMLEKVLIDFGKLFQRCSAVLGVPVMLEQDSFAVTGDEIFVFAASIDIVSYNSLI